MTTHALEQAISNLIKIEQINNLAEVQAIDTALAEVMFFNDPSVIRPLIRLIEDNAQYDDAIFSILHSIESFQDDVYISEVLKELPYFVPKAPRWASILFMRILNSESARECITEKLYFVNSEIKAAVLQITKMINDESPKFLEKTFTIINAAKKSG